MCQLCRRLARMRVCEQCGEPFEAQNAVDRPRNPNKYCSRACTVEARRMYDHPRAASKASSRARKARVRMTWDGVTDQQIFERDGWECRIPGCTLGPILRGLPWPGQFSPSIDHIIPLSLGGTDTAPNKRAAHLACNTRRGNRMDDGDVRAVTPELAPLGVLPERRVRKPGPLCGTCQTERVSRAGVTCSPCRQAAFLARQLQARSLRDRGFSWTEVAELLGLSGGGAAYNLAHGQGTAKVG